MKTYKLIIVMLLAAQGLGSSVLAQNITGHTNGHVILTDLLSLTVNQCSVDLVFDEPKDYIEGADTVMRKHLTVSSTRSFDIRVQSFSGTLNNGPNSLSSALVSVRIVGANASDFGILTTAPLLTAPQIIADQAPAQIMNSADVDYSISPAFAQAMVLGKPAGDYKTTVTYSIAAD